MGSSINCCRFKDRNDEENRQLETETHKQSSTKSEFSRRVKGGNLLTPDKKNDPNHKAATKIQSIVRRKLAKNHFDKIYSYKKTSFLNYLSSKNMYGTPNDINYYSHPTVKQTEKMIKNRQGVYDNPHINKDFYNSISTKSTTWYNFELGCVFLNEDHNGKPPVYKGFWNVNRKKNGYGILINSDGAKYEGNFRNEKLDGYGRYFTIKGDYFEGHFQQGIANGEGLYIHSDGNVYKGNWLNDLPWGEGEEWSNDGSWYKGDFKDGKKFGNGTFKWADGSTYTGDVKNDLLNGDGTYIWIDGMKYIGNWLDNMMSGKGNLYNIDGSYYEGEFLNGKKHGVGKYVWNENKYYEGEFRDGKQHGKGVMVKNGKYEEGLWQNGKKMKKMNSNGNEIYINGEN